MTSFEAVKGNSERAGLLTPTPFGVDSSQSTPGGTSDLVRPGEGNGEFPVGRSSSGEEPHLLSGLDGLSFISIPAGSTLKGSADILLYFSERTVLMVFQPTDVLIGRRAHIREPTEHIQGRGRLPPIDTGERSDPSTLMYRAPKG